jgi:hypothetical protein
MIDAEGNAKRGYKIGGAYAVDLYHDRFHSVIGINALLRR